MVDFTPEQREMMETVLKREMARINDSSNLDDHRLENILIMGMLNEQQKTNAKLESLITEIQHLQTRGQ
jgi:hypothetical protein